MALPTTPTLTVASTAAGKTQKISICCTELLLGWSDSYPTRSRIEFRNVLQGKGNKEVPIILLADHEDFVGCGFEGIFHDTQDLAGFVHRGQADQIGHVVLAFLRHVELITVKHQHFAFQGQRPFSALDTFHFDEKPFRSLPDSKNRASRAPDDRRRIVPDVLAGSDGTDLQGAAHPVRRYHDPDHHRIDEPRSHALILVKSGKGSAFPRLPGRAAAPQSGTSTVTRFPAFTDAAFTTVRIARIVLPWRPITRPMSSGATLSSRSTRESDSVPETSTLSGSSTSERARTSKRFSSCSTAGYSTPEIFNKLRTWSVGCAPLPSHSLAFTSSTFMSEGSCW